MDNLEQALRDDADTIQADVSAELDDRIRASLESVTPLRPRPMRRPVSMWWASSLTGLAAALAIIALINVMQPGIGDSVPETVAGGVNGAAVQPPVLPDLSARAAVMAGPLERELEDIEADLKKARQAVKNDLGFDL